MIDDPSRMQEKVKIVKQNYCAQNLKIKFGTFKEKIILNFYLLNVFPSREMAAVGLYA